MLANVKYAWHTSYLNYPQDVFSESDPFFTISRVNSDGSDTLVYRSEWIKVIESKTYTLVHTFKNIQCFRTILIPNGDL